MPKAVQMQLQMPFLRSTAAADLFLGPIKIEVLVKISQSNCQKFFLLTFLMMIIIMVRILLLFSSLAPHFFSLEKPHCTLQILEKPQPPIMTTVFQFVIFLLFRSKNRTKKAQVNQLNSGFMLIGGR